MDLTFVREPGLTREDLQRIADESRQESIELNGAMAKINAEINLSDARLFFATARLNNALESG